MAIDVSVIVPTYNRADLISYTLRSILGQSHSPAEVIVVDDGSSDETEAAVARFRPSVKYIRIENSGECKARNVGVSATSASWVAFCDSDDLWDRHKLECQVRLVEACPDVEYSFTNFRTVVDGQWSPATKFDTSPPGYWNLSRRTSGADAFVVEEPMFQRLLIHQPIFPSTLMMRRGFFEAAGRWRESLGRTPSVDLEFHLRCVTRPPIGVVSAPVTGIRKHAANFSGDPLKTTLGEVEILRYVLADHPGARDYARQIDRQIIARTASAAEGAFAAGRAALGRQLVRAVPYKSRSWKLHAKSLLSHAPAVLGLAPSVGPRNA